MWTLGVLAVAVLGCSNGEGDARSRVTSTSPGVATTFQRPDGPAAEVVKEIDGPGEPFMGEGVAFASDEVEQHEFVVAGTATSYEAPGGMGADGTWTFKPATTAAYRTRVVVRRPADMDTFSGTVVVEWLNVSGGVDANPDYTSLREELTRQGHVWVGVSAQFIGVEGGPVLVVAPGSRGLAGKGLKSIDPARYGELSHPGDAFSFDIFSQVARAVRQGGPIIGDGSPTVVIAAGESQSAIALTTYYNGVQPLTEAFDGFFVHSRAFAALPLVIGKYADLAGAMTSSPEPVVFRGDLRAPVMDIQAEGDLTGVLRSVDARQPDSDVFRLWEVAGTAHADFDLLGPEITKLIDCGAPINHAPMRFVVAAAFRALDDWITDGTPPPEAPRIDVTSGDSPKIVRDSNGIATGGIRIPPVAVPVDVLSGDPPPKDDLMCMLLGSTTPLPDEVIASLYDDRAGYEDAFDRATDDAVERGWLLDEDRSAVQGYAQPNRVG